MLCCTYLYYLETGGHAERTKSYNYAPRRKVYIFVLPGDGWVRGEGGGGVGVVFLNERCPLLEREGVLLKECVCILAGDFIGNPK